MTSTIKVDTISENTSANGVSIDGLTIKDGGITATTGTIVFNEAGADLDFRVESNGQANMFAVDGGLNVASIGGAVDTNATLLIHTTITDDNAGLTIKGAGSGTGARLAIADAGSNLGNRAETLEIGYDNSTDFIFSRTGQPLIIGVDSSEQLRIGSNLATGAEAAPDVASGGLCLQLNANDNQVLTFKSSDIAHGITGEAETDTFARFGKAENDKGGLYIRVMAEDNPNERLVFNVNGEGNITTTKSASGKGAVEFGINNKNGTGVTSVNSDANLLTINNHTSVQFIFDAEGTFHSNVGTATYDEYDDAHLVRAMDLSTSTKGLIASKFDEFIQYNHEDLAAAKIVGREEDGTPNSMVNWTAMSQLHNGAIWQQYEKTQRLTQAMYKLATKTIGKEEADKLLDEEEIKLLN